MYFGDQELDSFQLLLFLYCPLFFEVSELLLMLFYVLFSAGTFFLGSEPGNELGIRKADQREG
jgi:hypothetical protein